MNNVLTGNNDDNRLDGGAGADLMRGGWGRDTYVVDNVGDVIEDDSVYGLDTVEASISYVLGGRLENLVLTGSEALSGTGNASNNTLDGSRNAAANLLAGGQGNDEYIVGFGDIVSEGVNEGIDGVHSAGSYTLGENLENLELTGTANVNASGNALDNWLLGNDGDNVLDGAAGVDSLAGGLGNDTYSVDNVGDVVSEGLDAGIDLIESSVTWTLSANVENLTLTGSAAINASGNALDNVLSGNTNNNLLDGGAGNDVYVFARGGGQDTISEASDASAGKKNTLRFAAGISTADVAVVRSGSDLVVRIIGSSDSVMIQNFYLDGSPNNPRNPIQQIEFSDHTVWTIQDLVTLLNHAPTGDLSIVGTASANQVLYANNTLADADGMGALGFQWQSSTDGTTWSAISGATTNSYTLPATLVGKQVRVIASYTDGQGKLESVASSPTAAISAFNHAPTGAVTINGVAALNQVLSVSSTLADADGLGTMSYQWQSSTDGSNWSAISGATASTFTLSGAQLGKQVRVAASYLDGNGTLERQFSGALALSNTAPVFLGNLSSPGVVTTDGGSKTEWGYSVAAQADGKYLVSGTSLVNGYSDFTVLRYNSDGARDTSFDGDGQVTTALSAYTDDSYAVAVQADGRIVVGGFSYQGASDFSVARYNSDGSLDTSFSGDGKVTTDIRTNWDQAYSMALQADGKIVLAGFSSGNSSSNSDFALVRYNTNGSLDTSFDGDGKAVSTAGYYQEYLTSVAIQANGKILAAGWGADADQNNYDFVVQRYNANGSLDTSFSGDGIITIDSGGTDIAHAVLAQADGKVLAFGTDSSGAFLLRYNVNGSPDAGFGANGRAETAVNPMQYGNSIALQADGKILLTGFYNNNLALARYNSNGSLDAGFGNAGLVTTAVSSLFSGGNSIKVLADGKIVVAGGKYTTDWSTTDFILARFNADGTPDTTFGTDGHIADQTVSKGSLLSFVLPTTLFVDPDAGDVLTLAATRADGSPLPSWLSFNAATGSFSGTPTNGDVGSVSLKVTATDLAGASVASNAFTVTVASGGANADPTGSVSVGGTAAQNQMLTASNTLADADGLGVIGYQWQSSIDGSTWNAISGATASTFTLGEAQVGKQVRVAASYTDGHGTLESRASASTAAIANVNDAPTGAVTLTGTAAQNQILTAANTLADADGLGSIGYQWQSSIDGTTWSVITGATSSSFTLTEAQVGKQVRVVASYTDGHGTAESVTSSATAAITNANDAPTGVVTLTGTDAQNQTLTAANTLADSDGLGVIAYQWQSSTDGATWNAIAGATASSFTLGEAQVGKQIRVNASYTDGHGTFESRASASTASIANVNDAPTGSVTLAGTTAQNQTLTATNTLADVDGLGVISYQWQSSTDGTNWTTIGGGATASSFTLGEAQVGKQVRVNASYTDGHGMLESRVSASTASITNVNDAPTGTVTLTGSAAQNQILTAANTLADADGLGVIAYQWQSSIDGSTWSAISGATASTFTLGEAQVGKQVRVAASYTDGHGTAESVTSSATAAIANVNDAPTGAVSVSGTASQNQILTASNTLADADGLGTIAYQWQSSTDGTTWNSIAGATGSSFTLGEAQVGKQIRVNASYTDSHGTLESRASASTAAIANVNDAPTGAVSVSGTASQNQILTASNTLADVDGLGAIAYQWQSSIDGTTWGAISGATANTFTLGEAQVGKQVRVNASYTDGHGMLESLASAATAVIANVNDTPTGAVTLTGPAVQNQILTAANTLADADGLGAIAYQWQSSTDGTNWSTISGATANTFTLSEAHVGQQVRVAASYTDGHGTAESVASAATAAISNANDAPTGVVTLTGTAAQNQTLTAANTLADTDGLGVIGYQWQSSVDGTTWNAIAGATAGSFTLTEAQVGKQVRVAASYIDGHGTAESVTSSATAAIANVNDAPTGTVSVSGTASQNQILTADNTLADADGLGVIAYQWQSSNDGTAWSAITGATASSFTLGEAQVGKQVRVAAFYTDDHGVSESVVSTATAAIANVNDAPTGVVTLSGTASQNQILTAANTLADADGLGAIAYQWQSSADGSTWISIAGATASSFTLSEAQVGQQVRVAASYTDGHGSAESIASAATAAIASANTAPLVATPIADQNLVENASFHYTVAADTFSDVDVGDTLSLSASLASGDALPAWLSFDAASRTFSGAPGIGNLADLALRVRATDAAGATADALFHLAVVAAAPLVTTGGSGSDILTGLSGNDVLDGGAGNDIVIGGAGSDTLTGGSGSDALYGGAGDDTLLMSTDGHWVSGYVAFNAGSPGQAGSGEMVSITGRVTPFDLFDGGSGEDVLRGTSGNDAVFLDDGFSPLPGAMGPRIVGIEAIRAGDGDDVVDLTSQRYTYANVLLDGGNGNDVLWASAGNDAIQGGAGSDKLYGGAGKDLLIGGAGSDILDGASGADLLIGGAGNDSIITGAGADLIAFNQGDGFDTVTVGAGGKTISLGGGITYTDLSLSKSSNDLLLNTGSSEGLNFKNWYSGTANQNIVTLQIVAEAMAGFDAASSDPLLDNKLETFDFKGLVAAFDAARVASTVVSPWAVMHALLDRHLASSDSAALGGDLAYQYGMTGSLAGIGVGAAQQVLGKADFGSQAQDLQPVADLKVGGERLS
ncbi:putative Ig domain-containing protein [Propionivibrio sp.]|uniref:beta strand repeat-containing protein n=1 Tax=Propionivibrio sp. TaxID=2212460 RepID=UPI00261C1860|nr:putative Ig domain-containing protein [Propionivibrio sp.]